MTYKLYTFGTVTLPQSMASYDVGTGEAMSSYAPMPGGGAFDNFGTARSTGKPLTINHRALLTGAATAIESQLDTLKGLVGTYGTLTRLLPDASQHTIMARLISVKSNHNPGDLTRLQVDMNFQTGAACWSGTTLIISGVYLGTANSGTITAINNGNYPVINSIFNCYNDSGTVTQLTLIKTDQTSLKFIGNIINGKILTIDCGAYTVLNDGVNSFSNWTRQTGHKISEWVRIDPGTNYYTITRVGGGTADIAIYFTFYAGWA